MSYLVVFMGAGFGGMLRHMVGMWLPRLVGANFPAATMFVNITGSFLMGLAVGYFAFRASLLEGAGWHQDARLFLTTGLLGGYTTFSTFSLDTLFLFERGDVGVALAYLVGSVVLSLLAIFLALALMRGLVGGA
ncbi:fluoride efflux transporter CrcB [Xanthobacter sp. TB0139]|uniref:fluoride efflux transporter CrcB n=1 Tax=Xanthobacter sp. TB0139 TaxID=3459178 RepID=UPI004039EA57